MEQKMVRLLLLMFVAIIGICQGREGFNEWAGDDRKGVDTSGLYLCFLLNGEIQKTSDAVRCKFTTKYAAYDDDDAKMYCTQMMPFPYSYSKKTDDKNVVCEYFMTSQCSSMYTQLMGKCYIVKNYPQTYEEAKRHCENNDQGKNRRLARVDDPKLKEFFTGYLQIGAAWVDLENKHNYDLNVGEDQGVIFVDGAAFMYDRPVDGLVVVDKDEEYKFVCEYTPLLSDLDRGYIASKYSEIYPLDATGFQTSSLYTVRLVNDKIETDHLQDACKNAAKAFGLSDTTEVMPAWEEYLSKTVDSTKNTKFGLLAARRHTRRPDQWRCHNQYFEYITASGNILVVNEKSYGPQEDKSECVSQIMVFHKSKVYKTAEHYRAPLTCGVFPAQQEDPKCPDGWITFDRKDGLRFCHKPFDQPRDKYNVGTYTEARKFCQDQNAFLTGFESIDEYEEVKKSTHGNHGADHYYLGAILENMRPVWQEGVSYYPEVIESNFDYVDGEFLLYRLDDGHFHSHQDSFCVSRGFTCFPFCGKHAATIVVGPKMHN